MSPVQSALERRVRPVILVVDDDPRIREAFRLVLEEEPHVNGVLRRPPGRRPPDRLAVAST
jgi:CheY-like chemotaxis protein